MEIGDDLSNGDTQVSLELEEALFCAKLGVEIVLYCNIAGISTSEVKELIRLRGEYLKQEPEPMLKENLTQDSADSKRRKYMAVMDDKKDTQ
jgi:hypothetical protein